MSEVPTACILRISDEKTMQLLDLYRQEECLWNTNDEFYKDQLHRRRAAEKIATELDVPNFGPRHVLMKFKNLRNAYSQELKKLARLEGAGMSYKPSVFWFKKMDAFIKPHLQKPRFRRSTGPQPSVVYQVDGTEGWLQNNPPYLLTTEIEEPSSENDSCDSQRKRKSQNTPTWPKRLRDSDSDEPKFIEISIPQTSEIETHINEDNAKIDPVIKQYIDDQQNTVMKSFNDLSCSLRALASRDDDVFGSFGKYVAGLLRTLPPNKALEVQPQIINLITRAGLDNIVSKRSQPRDSVVVKIEEC